MLLYLYREHNIDFTELKSDVMSIKWDYSLSDFFVSNTRNLEDFFKIIIEDSFIDYENYDHRLNIEKIIVIASDINYQKLYHLGIKAIASLEEPIVTLNDILFLPKVNIKDMEEIITNISINNAELKEKNGAEKSKTKVEKKENLKQNLKQNLIEEPREKLETFDEKIEINEAIKLDETKDKKLNTLTILLTAGGIISSLLLLYISYNF